MNKLLGFLDTSVHCSYIHIYIYIYICAPWSGMKGVVLVPVTSFFVFLLFHFLSECYLLPDLECVHKDIEYILWLLALWLIVLTRNPLPESGKVDRL